MRNQALKRVAAMLFALAVILPSAFAQEKVTISGKVLAETGYPMIGAGIVQLGTNDQVGTVTDFDGNYTLQVPKGSTVEIRMIGYKFVSKTVNATETFNVQLQPDTELIEETVVVGYGVQKKSDLTGSISQVKSTDIENRTITSAGQALQGKTAGVSVFTSSAAPGASPTIRIRGISSNGDSDPLYVVDGRITDDISGIDPNDIESMEVLKDAASAAIYGAQAGNGVVLITTRKGKGDGKINYSYQLTAQSLAKVPKVMNSEQYIQYYLEDGRISMEDVYTYWDFKTNTDWLDYAYETSIMQHHNLSFSSGDEKGSLYVSLAYLYNDGMFAGSADTYERVTGMINATKKVKSWLEITTNNQIEYYASRSVSTGSDYGSAVVSALMLDPLTPTTYTAENLPSYMSQYLDLGYELLTDENGNYYAASAFSTSENVNPRVMRDRSYSKTVGFNLNGSSALNFTPIKGLTITSRLGYRLSAYDTYGYSQNYYINTNAYQNYVGLSGTVGDTMYYQWENFANYMKQIKKHTLVGMIGMSYSQSRTNYVSGSYQGGDDDLGVEQDDPLFYYFSYATSSATKYVYGSEPTYSRKLSYFGRLSWNYLSKYYVQASFRADAADLSILPKAKRWGYFPSVSGGWTISEEPFFEPLKSVVEFAKIRASWGQNGSIASLGSYAYANTIASTGNYPTGNGTEYILGYAPTTSGNDDLKWETSEQLDFGLDLRFLRGRLTFSGDWYKKKTKDLIVTGITPSNIVGVSASPVNAGNVENTGVELELSWKDQIGNFSYGITANASTLKNEVTYVHESLSDGIDGVGIRNYGTITRFEMGYPAWHFYGYKYTGVDPATGDALFEDLTGDGEITDADKTDLGSGIPDLTYGITLNAAWKGFDAVVFMTGTAGSQIFQGLNVVDYKTNKLTYYYDNRWTEDDPYNAKTPGAAASNWNSYLTSSGVVFSGNYFKIKQIQVGYTIPSNITKKVKIDNFRVYVSLDDFFTFTDYTGFDPEVTGVGSSLGVDKGSYPTSKKMVFGVNVTF